MGTSEMRGNDPLILGVLIKVAADTEDSKDLPMGTSKNDDY
jgi:hypothetical protein